MLGADRFTRCKILNQSGLKIAKGWDKTNKEEQTGGVGNKLSGEQRVKVKAASINCVCVDNGGTIGHYTVASKMLHSAG